MHHSGASRRGNADSCHNWSDVIARSEATKQSILFFAAMDCFASLAMTVMLDLAV